MPKWKGGEGERYVQQRPYLEKWINQCGQCQTRGYKPDMPEFDPAVYNYAFKYLRRHFKPLELDGDGLCGVCQRHRR